MSMGPCWRVHPETVSRMKDSRGQSETEYRIYTMPIRWGCVLAPPPTGRLFRDRGGGSDRAWPAGSAWPQVALAVGAVANAVLAGQPFGLKLPAGFEAVQGRVQQGLVGGV